MIAGGQEITADSKELYLSISSIWLGTSVLISNRTHPVFPVLEDTQTLPGFIGHIHTFMLNGVDYLQRAKAKLDGRFTIEIASS